MRGERRLAPVLFFAVLCSVWGVLWPPPETGREAPQDDRGWEIDICPVVTVVCVADRPATVTRDCPWGEVEYEAPGACPVKGGG